MSAFFIWPNFLVIEGAKNYSFSLLASSCFNYTASHHPGLLGGTKSILMLAAYGAKMTGGEVK